jgi:VanZ family protein
MQSVFLEKPEPEAMLRFEARFGALRTALWIWLPPVIALTIIATESTNTFSAEHTSSWLRPIFERHFGPVSDARWGAMHHYFRKSGHFGGYGLVCLTFLRAWLITLAVRAALGLWAWRGRAAAFAIACTAGVASLDEWHQTFIPSRTGTFHDVILDTCGATVMCGVVALFCWRGRRIRE